MSNKKITYLLIFLVIFILLFFLNRFNAASDTTQVFRDTSDVIYTKHARCRMDCRQINEREIKEIIAGGKLNHSKSGKGRKNDETYAIEGYSYENQHIRVVVTPQPDGLLVITAIDLDKEWPCHCN